jgi:2-phosphoglycolate phosphatase
MTACAHVVFDLDGTLVDSAQTVQLLINELRHERGLPSLGVEQLVPLISLGGVQMMQGAVCADVQEATKALAVFRARYAERPTPIDSVYPGVESVLSSLHEANVCMSICTNKPRLLAHKVLGETGLARFFRYVCAGDDLQTRKPDRANLEACRRAVGTHGQRVWVVGDSTVDEALARNGAVPFVFFSAGYDDGVSSAEAAHVFSTYLRFPVELIIE